MRPAPAGPDALSWVHQAAEDCSPSRARLGRVAEMLREAEVALPLTRRRERPDPIPRPVRRRRGDGPHSRCRAAPPTTS